MGRIEQLARGLLGNFLNNRASGVLLPDLPQFLREFKTHLERIFMRLAWVRGGLMHIVCPQRIALVQRREVQIKINVDMVAERGGCGRASCHGCTTLCLVTMEDRVLSEFMFG